VLDTHALAYALGAGAHSGSAVHLHEAVRALAGTAEEAPPAVVLEAAGEGALPGGVQRRADRVALEGLDRFAVEAEAEPAPAIEALVRLGRKARHGRSVNKT